MTLTLSFAQFPPPPHTQPNAIARIVNLESTKKIIIVAKRHIKPGEEVRLRAPGGGGGGGVQSGCFVVVVVVVVVTVADFFFPCCVLFSSQCYGFSAEQQPRFFCFVSFIFPLSHGVLLCQSFFVCCDDLFLLALYCV